MVRRALEGWLNLSAGVRLTDEQQYAIQVIVEPPGMRRFTSAKALNLARRVAPPVLYEFLARCIAPLRLARYQRRWARRLRQQFGFEREDAHQLSLASFGCDEAGSLLSVDLFVTFDLRLLQRFHTHHADIARAFQRMTCQLALPYRDAELPQVVTPQDVLSRFEL